MKERNNTHFTHNTTRTNALKGKVWQLVLLLFAVGLMAA